MTFVCGNRPVVELPDAGEGMCCYGATIDASRCTCWDESYDLDQADQLPDAHPGIRTEMCEDCAYRPGSPELTGVANVSGDEDDLRDHVVGGFPFFCHQGTRRRTRWTHPTGVVVQGDPADYDPPIVEAWGVKFPLKADGSGADRCAGWTARRRAFLATQISTGHGE